MLPSSIKKLIDQIDKLPGIGLKTAERLAFWLLKQPQEDLEEFANSLKEAKKDLIVCSVCQNIAETNPCSICSDQNREQNIICVVSESQDVQAFERLKEYKGLYHILGGVLNPLENMGPEKLNIDSLINRIKNNGIQEIILGFNPDLEGESTAQYLERVLKPLNIKVTKLARGLPTGSDIEYADNVTLTSALKNRKEV